MIARLALDIIAFFGLGKIKINASDQGLFLKDSELRSNTKLFEKYFGNNDFLALLVESDDIFNPDVLKMIRELGETLQEEIPLCDAVISLANFELPVPTPYGCKITQLIPDSIPKGQADLNKLKE